MKKNEKKTNGPFWSKWTKSPGFSRNILIIAILILIIILSLFTIWKRYAEKEFEHASSLHMLPSQQEEQAIEEFKSLSNSLKAIQDTVIQQQHNLQIPHKLIAVELLRGVLDDLIPLETLKTFLQKNPEPWAQELLTTLGSVKENTNYAQLEALLAPTTTKSHSLWERFKKTIKSLIHIQKRDEDSSSKPGRVKDVKKAIRSHDIAKALIVFEKLPSEEKAQLSAWKELAKGRLLLEQSTRKLLLDLAGS